MNICLYVVCIQLLLPCLISHLMVTWHNTVTTEFVLSILHNININKSNVLCVFLCMCYKVCMHNDHITEYCPLKIHDAFTDSCTVVFWVCFASLMMHFPPICLLQQLYHTLTEEKRSNICLLQLFNFKMTMMMSECVIALFTCSFHNRCHTYREKVCAPMLFVYGCFELQTENKPEVWVLLSHWCNYTHSYTQMHTLSPHYLQPHPPSKWVQGQ